MISALLDRRAVYADLAPRAEMTRPGTLAGVTPAVRDEARGRERITDAAR